MNQGCPAPASGLSTTVLHSCDSVTFPFHLPYWIIKTGLDARAPCVPWRQRLSTHLHSKCLLNKSMTHTYVYGSVLNSAQPLPKELNHIYRGKQANLNETQKLGEKKIQNTQRQVGEEFCQDFLSSQKHLLGHWEWDHKRRERIWLYNCFERERERERESVCVCVCVCVFRGGEVEAGKMNISLYKM